MKHPQAPTRHHIRLPHAQKLRLGQVNAGVVTAGLFDHFITLMQEQNLDMLFISETGTKDSNHWQSRGYHVYCTGSETGSASVFPDEDSSDDESPGCEQKQGREGVAVICAPKISPFVSAVKAPSGRHLLVEISAQGAQYALIGTYAPTQSPDHRIARRNFWRTLTTMLDEIPGPYFKAVIGDLNTRLQGRGIDETDHIGPKPLRQRVRLRRHHLTLQPRPRS